MIRVDIQKEVSSIAGIKKQSVDLAKYLLVGEVKAASSIPLLVAI